MPIPKPVSLPSVPPRLIPWLFFKLRVTPLLCLLAMLVGLGIHAQASAPGTITMTPTAYISATGAAHRVTVTYTDPDGGADLVQMRVQINSTQNPANALYGYYNSATSRFNLYDDDGVTLLPTNGHAGDPVTISNSQGTLDYANSTVSVSGNTVTIGWSFTPSSTFTGVQNVYGYCRDATTNHGWDTLGTWQIDANAAPTVTSLSPATGASNSGVARDMTVVYRDTNSSSSIRDMRIDIDTAVDNTSCLSAIYNKDDGKLYLYDDNGVLMPTGYAPGSANVLTNSQGSLNCADTSVSLSGSNATVVWNFTPSAYVNSSGGNFSGAKNVYAYCVDSSAANSGWQNMGTWTVNPIAATAPINVSVSPSSVTTLTSRAQKFTTRFSDANGALDIQYANVLINTSATTGSSIYARYDRTLNKLSLSQDDGTLQGTGYAPGDSHTLSNSQGTLNCADTAVRISGKNIDIDWSFTPATGFTGTKNFYGKVYDYGGLATGWTDLGDWTINLAPPSVPTGLVLTPGTYDVNQGQQYTLTWDASTDITSYFLLIGTTSSLTINHDGVGSLPKQPRSYSFYIPFGQTRYVALDAFYNADDSGLSAVINATAPPAPVTTLAASPGNAQVTLTWTQVSGATDYKIFRRIASGSYNYSAPLNASTIGQVSTYSDTTATNGTNFYYVVRAVGVGSSTNSNEVNATPSAPPTSVPTVTSIQGQTGSVVLNWTPASGLHTKVLRSTDGTNYSVLNADTTLSTLTDSSPSVANGTKYYYVLKAFNVGGDGPGSTAVSATPLAAPVVIATTGGGQITLSWGAVPGVTTGTAGYKVFRSTTSGTYNYTTPLTPTTATTYVDPSPTIGTPYYYVVRSEAANSESSSSSQVSATRPAPPVAPTLSSVANNNAVALSWNSVTSATSYILYRSTVSNTYSTPLTTISAGSPQPATYTYTDSTAVNGQLYYYVVKASSNDGTSPNSNQVSVTPQPAPSAPASLTANAGTGKVTLTWPASVTATSYRIYRKSGAGTLALVGTSATSPATDTGAILALANGTLYTYTVRALNSSGESIDSSTATATPIDKVINLVATAQNGQVKLDWNSVVGATKYGILRAVGVAGTPATLATHPTTNTFTDPGLTNGTLYRYQVFAENVIGTGDASDEASATPVAPTPPPAPTNLVATAGTSQVVLTWAASTGATSYGIKRSTTSGTGYTTLTPAAGTNTFTDPVGAANNGTKFYYKVFGINAAGNGADSSEASATPMAVPVVTPHAGNAEITLSWPAVTGATSYGIRSSGTPGGPYVNPEPTTSDTTYTVTGLSNGSPRYFRVYALNSIGKSLDSTEVSATPQSLAFELLNLSNGDIISGNHVVQARIYISSILQGQLIFYVDNKKIDVSHNDVAASTLPYTQSWTLPTQLFGNGTHTIKLSSVGYPDQTAIVTFQNELYDLRYSSVFSPGGGTAAPIAFQFSAKFTQSKNWTLNLKDYDDNIKRTFSGTGTQVNVSWDGNSATGTELPDGTYFMSLTTTNVSSLLRAGSFRLTSFSSKANFRLVDVGGGGRDLTEIPILKDRLTDSVLIIDPDAVVGGLSTAKRYAKFIESMVNLKYGTTLNDAPHVLIVSGGTLLSSDGLSDDNSALGYSVDQWIDLKFNQTPSKLVYVCTHGGVRSTSTGTQVPFFGIGPHIWASGPFYLMNPATGDEDLSATVAPLGYGTNAPPRLVWIDSCDSGGDPAGSTTWSSAFASTFGIPAGLDNGYTDGIFLGWYGSAGQYGLGDSWEQWRVGLWTRLFAGSKNFITSANQTDSTVPLGTPPSPQNTRVWYGSDYTAF